MLLDFEPVPDPDDDLRASATPVANKLQQKSAAIKGFFIEFTVGVLTGGMAYFQKLPVFCVSMAGFSLFQCRRICVFPIDTAYTELAPQGVLTKIRISCDAT